ncbi:MAG TPA: hypothetical protein VFO21_16135 [Vicinamibacterales bacterium]|nr:hypothetical protein [Vicinamibacterales bacterium]
MDGKQPGFVRMFVRIGALKRFHFLKKKTADLPVSVEWDRRRSDRRSAEEPETPDLRGAERRGTPPFTWDTADFVVVEESPVPVGADKKNSD